MANQPSNEEVIENLSTLAKSTACDEFTIRISRKGKPPAMIPEVVVSLEGATLTHIVHPETWLPALLGGGQFIITVFHASEPSRQVGHLQYTFKEPERPGVDRNAMNLDGWVGPARIAGPIPHLPERPQGTVYGDQPSRVQITGGTSQIDQPRAAPQGVDKDTLILLELQQLKGDYKHVLEREAQQAKAISDMFAQLRTDISRQPQVPQKPAISPELVAALAPIGAAVVQHFLAAPERQAQLARESNEQNQKMMAILLKATEPKGIDPALEKLMSEQRKLIERVTERGEPDQSEVLMQMSGVVNQMLGLAVKATSAVAEANLGNKESSFMPAFREAMNAVQGIFMATQAAKANKNAQPRLPQNAGQPQPIVQTQGQPGVVDQLVDAIKSHRNPEEVAAVIIKLAEDDNVEFTSAVEAAGSINNLFVQRVGAEWALIPENRIYTVNLFDALTRLSKDSDSVSDEAPEDEDEGEPDEIRPAAATQAPASA